MNAWMRALRAELLKLKNTLALWMVLASPLTIAALLVLEMILIAHRSPASATTVTPAIAWQGLGTAMFSLWCLIMLPLFVTLQTALLAGLEHGNNQWKHLLALPIPRSAHYLAKLTILVLMVVCAYLILLCLTPVAGWILMYAVPSSGLTGTPILGSLIRPILASLAASFLIMSAQTWIALRWPSFTIAVSVGIIATVIGLIAGQSHFGMYFPWTLPVQAFAGDGSPALAAVYFGLVGGCVVGILGLIDFLRRDCI